MQTYREFTILDNSQTDGDLVFIIPDPKLKCPLALDSNMAASPTIGKIFLFPDILSHGIYRNQTDQN